MALPLARRFALQTRARARYESGYLARAERRCYSGRATSRSARALRARRAKTFLNLVGGRSREAPHARHRGRARRRSVERGGSHLLRSRRDVAPRARQSRRAAESRAAYPLLEKS